MDFGNSTSLGNGRLEGLFREALADWSVGSIVVRVRYGRGADFSGRCLYTQRRIYVNLGRHLGYPYALATNLARVQTQRHGWRRDIYTLTLSDAYQLAMFIFLHELYHLLVYRAGRNTRQKESMCDRFAARYLVDRFGCTVREADGRPVPRETWDFQDLNGFVGAARCRQTVPAAARVAEPRQELDLWGRPIGGSRPSSLEISRGAKSHRSLPSGEVFVNALAERMARMT